jgi:LacI family transcriptional regulator
MSRPPNAAHVTLADVAAHAGVSRATASLVLRDTGSLTEDTRNRVRASMNELGYVYHRGAASLRASRTQSIGVIVSDISNGFTAELTVGLEEALAAAGVVALIANTLESTDRQELLVRSMLERQVDGLLIIPAIGTTRAMAERLSTVGVPVVIASRDIAVPGLSYVGIDNVTGGSCAAEHLLTHTNGPVAFLGGFTELGPRQDRVAGIKRALATASDAWLEVDIPGPPNGSWGLETARRLLDDGSLPPTIICLNDQVAFGVYRALREARPEGPSPVRVVSFDDVAEAALWEPPLTTIAASGHEVGVRCADILLGRIEAPDGPTVRTLITPTIVVRESCGCLV